MGSPANVFKMFSTNLAVAAVVTLTGTVIAAGGVYYYTNSRNDRETASLVDNNTNDSQKVEESASTAYTLKNFDVTFDYDSKLGTPTSSTINYTVEKNGLTCTLEKVSFENSSIELLAGVGMSECLGAGGEEGYKVMTKDNKEFIVYETFTEETGEYGVVARFVKSIDYFGDGSPSVFGVIISTGSEEKEKVSEDEVLIKEIIESMEISEY
jgi:hypothetical protein